MVVNLLASTGDGIPDENGVQIASWIAKYPEIDYINMIIQGIFEHPAFQCDFSFMGKIYNVSSSKSSVLFTAQYGTYCFSFDPYTCLLKCIDDYCMRPDRADCYSYKFN